MKRCILVLLTLIMLSSCATTQEAMKDTTKTLAISEDLLPRTVAVMPFQNETDEVGIANQLRKNFYNHFSSKPYRDIELPVIDEKIVLLEKSTGKNILDLGAQEICQTVGCDGLVYGKVTDFKKVYVGVYSQLGVEAEIWMVNTKTGKEVLRIKDSVRYHEGGIPTSPLSAIMTAVSTAMNIREIQRIRMVNELCYKFTEKIPSPAGMAVEDRPAIKEVLTNVKEGPFGKGKIIRAGLDGEKGLVATFDIGNFKRGILMKETKPGIYTGEYLVLPGDNVKDMPVIASLKRPGGYESQWIDASGLVTIDTTPPPQIKMLRAKGFHDRIEITWDALKNIPDLKGYAVLKSEQPLSGYIEVARVEVNTFEDRQAKSGTVYHYKVVAFDQTGNESDPQDPVRAALSPKEPVTLSGEIKKDTVLSGNYVIKGELKVPKGLLLTLEPETRVMFDEGSFMKVFGTISASSKDNVVEFVSATDKGWKGIIVDGGRISVNGFRIKGAEVALNLQNADGMVENGVITENTTGISVAGTPSVTVKNSTLSGNKMGIELLKTDAKIMSNTIIQNTDGIVLKGFSGEIKDNIVMDNIKNITSESTVKIGPNYLGSINVDEMKVINVSVTKVYDHRPPDGKIVDALSNPYASLNQEERQKKATEILIEAGQYFRQRNYGKASALFEEALKASPAPEIYYYLAICYQEMKEDEKALKYLREGVSKFPRDTTMWKSIGMIYYQKGDEQEAKKAFTEVVRLSPEDRQVRFLLERIGK